MAGESLGRLWGLNRRFPGPYVHLLLLGALEGDGSRGTAVSFYLPSAHVVVPAWALVESSRSPSPRLPSSPFPISQTITLTQHSHLTNSNLPSRPSATSRPCSWHSRRSTRQPIVGQRVRNVALQALHLIVMPGQSNV